MNSGRMRRLSLLEIEAVTTPQERAAEMRLDEDPRYQAAWAIMRTTMSEEHARVVMDAFPKGRWAIYSTPAGRLLNACLDAISRPGGRWDNHWAYKGVRPEVALAMPPEVAQVYLDQPGALALEDCCEDCGYRVPLAHFQTCPLCGGKVDRYAFWKKRMDNPA